MGIPIETLGNHADPNDLREARYRIPQSEYDLPEDLTFTPAELAVLSLAGGVWSEGSMSSEAQSGLRKIRALGIDVDEPILGFAPRMTAREAAFGPLQQAIDACVEVEFCLPQAGGGGAHRSDACAHSRSSTTRRAGTCTATTRSRRAQDVPAQPDRRGRRTHRPRRSTRSCATARGSAPSRGSEAVAAIASAR